MTCGHGYCLFPCEKKEDCADFPGFVCDNHGGGLYCEM